MSLHLPHPTQPRRSKTILSPDGITAKFLYTIIKQLDLKSIDWNLVASQLDITNGHAARMRYSRFKTQIESMSRGEAYQNSDRHGKGKAAAKRRKCDNFNDPAPDQSANVISKRLKVEERSDMGGRRVKEEVANGPRSVTGPKLEELEDSEKMKMRHAGPTTPRPVWPGLPRAPLHAPYPHSGPSRRQNDLLQFQSPNYMSRHAAADMQNIAAPGRHIPLPPSSPYRSSQQPYWSPQGVGIYSDQPQNAHQNYEVTHTAAIPPVPQFQTTPKKPLSLPPTTTGLDSAYELAAQASYPWPYSDSSVPRFLDPSDNLAVPGDNYDFSTLNLDSSWPDPGLAWSQSLEGTGIDSAQSHMDRATSPAGNAGTSNDEQNAPTIVKAESPGHCSRASPSAEQAGVADNGRVVSVSEGQSTSGVATNAGATHRDVITITDSVHDSTSTKPSTILTESAPVPAPIKVEPGM